MNVHIKPEEFGDAPWAALHTSAGRLAALVVEIEKSKWFVAEAGEDGRMKRAGGAS